MRNLRGRSIVERLNEDIEFAENNSDAEQREILAIKALGAADLAVEFGLITYKEWETYTERVFNMMM